MNGSPLSLNVFPTAGNRNLGRGALWIAPLLWAAGAVAGNLPETREWRGDLSLPNGATLPIEVELFLNAAGEPDGNLISPAQDQRYARLVEVEFADDRLRVLGRAPDVEIAGPIDNGTWQATFSQGGFQAELSLAPTAQVTEVERPQSAAALRDWPGEARRIPAKGAVLAGTHVRPSEGTRAAALLLGGSGATERDGYFAGHRPLAVLAAQLAERGIASLRYDKRGVNRSSGEHDPTDIDTLTRDAEAALRFLRARHPGLPLLVIGHSEGGLIAARLGAGAAPPDGVVSLMGPVLPLAELFALQDRTEARAAGASESEADALVSLSRQIYEAAAKHSDPASRMPAVMAVLESASDAQRQAFERFNGGTGTLGPGMLGGRHYHTLLAVAPKESWGALDVPGLLLFGELDSQVPAAANIEVLPKRDGLSIVTLPGINHVMQRSDSAATQRYAEIDHVVAAEVESALAQWIEQWLQAAGHNSTH
ncbi:alpha/beta hydrolase [Pseudomarimonas salicorniae]|uniref:Lysophospholipase n=1 Tax=Pseudomarimonas salicorniae TaxID=2933270 RepID=A0ABT0GC65_9GAMM|nr:alpha/beta hydrolase [Lysobacter sp. CAU 1642]MCK7592121.1 lysophospholipase [Lysobacter sp. CAU 1642]